MTSIDEYREALERAADQEVYLLAHSGLPGPRGNLELARAAAEVCSQHELRRWARLGSDEASDPAFAVGFGDVDVHEVATGRGPDADLAYFAHYSGGIRVTRFNETSITEVGRFIDEGGNDFWGVQLTDKFVSGDRVVAYSDRDYGLYLATYTGP